LLAHAGGAGEQLLALDLDTVHARDDVRQLGDVERRRRAGSEAGREAGHAGADGNGGLARGGGRHGCRGPGRGGGRGGGGGRRPRALLAAGEQEGRQERQGGPTTCHGLSWGAGARKRGYGMKAAGRGGTRDDTPLPSAVRPPRRGAQPTV